jgi:hypothetical protein
MLYMRYVHLTKAKRSLFLKDKSILSPESMLHKYYECKCSVAKKKNTGREPQGCSRQDELIDGKLLVVKQT